jgi:hypothetical protein
MAIDQYWQYMEHTLLSLKAGFCVSFSLKHGCVNSFVSFKWEWRKDCEFWHTKLIRNTGTINVSAPGIWMFSISNFLKKSCAWMDLLVHFDTNFHISWLSKLVQTVTRVICIGRWPILISAGKPTILTEAFRGFPLALPCKCCDITWN